MLTPVDEAEGAAATELTLAEAADGTAAMAELDLGLQALFEGAAEEDGARVGTIVLDLQAVFDGETVVEGRAAADDVGMDEDVGIGAAMEDELSTGAATEEEAETTADVGTTATVLETTAELVAALVVVARVVGLDPPAPAAQTATGPPGAV